MAQWLANFSMAEPPNFKLDPKRGLSLDLIPDNQWFAFNTSSFRNISLKRYFQIHNVWLTCICTPPCTYRCLHVHKKVNYAMPQSNTLLSTIQGGLVTQSQLSWLDLATTPDRWSANCGCKFLLAWKLGTKSHACFYGWGPLG